MLFCILEIREEESRRTSTPPPTSNELDLTTITLTRGAIDKAIKDYRSKYIVEDEDRKSANNYCATTISARKESSSTLEARVERIEGKVDEILSSATSASNERGTLEARVERIEGKLDEILCLFRRHFKD